MYWLPFQYEYYRPRCVVWYRALGPSSGAVASFLTLVSWDSLMYARATSSYRVSGEGLRARVRVRGTMCIVRLPGLRPPSTDSPTEQQSEIWGTAGAYKIVGSYFPGVTSYIKQCDRYMY